MQADNGATWFMLVWLIACKPAAQAVEEVSVPGEHPDASAASTPSVTDTRSDRRTYHFVNADGQVAPEPLELAVTDEGAGKRVVRYQYGMSEGNGFVFANEGGVGA